MANTEIITNKIHDKINENDKMIIAATIFLTIRYLLAIRTTTNIEMINEIRKEMMDKENTSFFDRGILIQPLFGRHPAGPSLLPEHGRTLIPGLSSTQRRPWGYRIRLAGIH